MNYNPLRAVILLSILIIYTSCKTTARATTVSAPSKAPLSEADKAFIADFTKQANVTHLVLGCKVYDFSGKLLAGFNGNLCWFEDDGHILVSSGQFSYLLDPIQNARWVTINSFHHTLNKSEFRNEYLTLNSEYLKTKESPSVRYDSPVVLGRNGKILRSFKFSEYDKTNPLPRPPRDDLWSVEKVPNAKEFTHGNSFKELWTIKNGKKRHSGYVYYSSLEKFIYFFDPSLKKVISKINVADRVLHTVQQYNEKQLIAYGNSRGKNGVGAIYLIDMKDHTVHELYKFTDTRQGSVSCSSVQVLPANRLFIVHSKCEEPLSNNTHLEYVDLNSGKSVIQWIDLAHPPIYGSLWNLSAFFSNSYSH